MRLQIWEKAVRPGARPPRPRSRAASRRANVVAQKVAKKLIELKRNCEATMLSDNESRVDTGAVGKQTRGPVKWAQATAQSHYPCRPTT